MLRKLVLALVALPVLLAAVYLLAANLFLATPTGHAAISRRPERLLVEWDRAWSYFPGRVEVRGLRLRGQNQVIQWELELERATVPVSLRELTAKHFSTTAARGSGLSFRLRRRLDRLPDPERARWTPEIRGLENPPSAAPEELYPPGTQRNPWRVTLDDLQIEDVREVWLEEARLEGAGQLEGGLAFQAGGDFEMPGAHLVVPQGEVETAGGTVARDLRLDVEARIHPFSPRGEGARAVFRYLSGTLSVAGPVETIEPLNGLFRRAPWLHAQASGHLDAEVSIDRGRLLPASRASVDASELAVAFAGYRATGVGRLEAGVEPGQPAPRLEASFDMHEVQVQREGWERPHAAGARLLLTARSEQLQLDEDPFADLETRLEISDAVVDDLSVYNHYLPAGGVVLKGGTGRLSAWLQASVEAKSATGAIDLNANAVRVAIGDIELRGRLDLDTRLPRAWLVDQRYDLSGTVLRLSDVTVREHDKERRGWWARLELDEAELAHRDTVEIDAQLRAVLRDSGPIVALAAEKKRFVGMFDGLLTVESVRGATRFRSGAAGLELERMSVTGDRLEILGDLHLTQADRSGLLFLRLGRLSAAVDLKGDERDWKLLGSRKWFEARRAERAAAPGSAPPLDEG